MKGALLLASGIGQKNKNMAQPSETDLCLARKGVMRRTHNLTRSWDAGNVADEARWQDVSKEPYRTQLSRPNCGSDRGVS